MFAGSAVLIVLLFLDVGLLGPRSAGKSLESVTDASSARVATGRP